MDLAGDRGRAPAADDAAPKTSPATPVFVSRLRDMLTTSCRFSVVPGFPYEPIFSTQDAYLSSGPLPSDPVSQSPQRAPFGHIKVHTPSDRHRPCIRTALAEPPVHITELYRPFPQKCRRIPERRERSAQPVCSHAAHGAFTIRHARLHVQAVLDEIVTRAAFKDAPSATARLLLRLLMRLRLRFADRPKLPSDS